MVTWSKNPFLAKISITEIFGETVEAVDLMAWTLYYFLKLLQ